MSQIGSVTERFVRRVSRDTLIVRNADALAGFAHEPASLVVACRRAVARGDGEIAVETTTSAPGGTAPAT